MRYIFYTFYQIFNRHQKIRMCILLCMMVIGAIFETVGVSLIFPFISLVLDSESVFNNEIMYAIYCILGMKGSRDFLIVVSIGLICIFVFKNLYLYFMYSIQYRFASNNKLQMSSKLFSIYLNKPYEFYLSRNASEIIRNVNTDVANVFTLLTTILQMLTEIITALGLLAVLMVVDFRMTLFVSILLMMAIATMKYIFKPIQRITGVRARNSDAEIIKWLNQSVHGIKEVKVTESESFFYENYYKSGLVSAEASRKFNVINTIPQLFIELVFMVGIISYIVFLLVSGENVSNLVPQISAFAMAAIRLLPIANRINRHLGVIAYSVPSLESVKQEFSMECKPTMGPESMQRRAAKQIERKLANEIRFDNVSFRYDNSSKWVLEQASLSIPIGKTVGIVGPSGSGKTTLIDLLLGLLVPVCGEITADGESILDDPEGWLNRIGYVSQSMYLTEDSIRKNIAFGQEDGQIDDKKIDNILKLACLEEFISDLPNGIETKVGEFGTKLSGGQKQRVCIARALYYDPEILILDEATSALDYDTENEIMENISHLRGRITMIIIAHRLQTLKDCDAVYMVNEGKIVRHDQSN